MIYNLWGDTPKHNDMELEDKILNLARILGESYDWKRTAPSVISAKAWKIVQDIARAGQALTNIDAHCEIYLKDFATRMVADGFDISKELRKLEDGNVPMDMRGDA